MKTIQQKDEKRHGRARSDGQMRDAMTTASIPNNHLIRAMRQSIRRLEKNGFRVRRILPADPMAGSDPVDSERRFCWHLACMHFQP